jgi:[ribosomal protein S5]-alanine N-acetyltransferase
VKSLLLQTERTDLYIQNCELIDLIADYYQENRIHLSPWEPVRDEDYFEEEQIAIRLDGAFKSYREGQSVQLAALNKNHNEIIGVCNFTNIVHGPFQACFLGYSIGKKYEGQGFMFEILSAANAYMFREKGLHRIMANYIPSNKRSGKLLNRLGFEEEGLARSYLKINGKWEDHILTSLINSL